MTERRASRAPVRPLLTAEWRTERTCALRGYGGVDCLRRLRIPFQFRSGELLMPGNRLNDLALYAAMLGGALEVIRADGAA
jgi:hypothetical protein